MLTPGSWWTGERGLLVAGGWEECGLLVGGGREESGLLIAGGGRNPDFCSQRYLMGVNGLVIKTLSRTLHV